MYSAKGAHRDVALFMSIQGGPQSKPAYCSNIFVYCQRTLSYFLSQAAR